MNISTRLKSLLFSCAIVMGAMFASCKTKEIVSYPGTLKKFHVKTNVEWNKEFPTLRDSSYRIWKKDYATFYNPESKNEDSVKLVKTLFIQEYKIYIEDLKKDGFSQSILNYLIPCQDSALLLVFPGYNKNSWSLQLQRSKNANNKWGLRRYGALYATLKQVEDVLKNKHNTLFF